ncbi:disulfide bond formation protein DsbA [Paenarthrobacter nitroguajacolicus]|uniref:Disulfide bond formation protein DsbA n=1 Tax=Paenarthrobacter nitroguajacolicus TaxID=211146 RepID=A0A558GYN1_PAENT|nr:thioredoxin domain-containing protein [Paenarthrobacter nitroguajacolicus]TVU61988.1 disulfide bond formation protein DsbA [Paenarthrobacter nitroguajacolicus]
MSKTQTPPPPMDTAKKARVFIWVLLAVLVAVGVIWYTVFTLNKPAPAAPTPVAEAQLVREDSHRVTSPATEKAQLVEFLDFECEACLAAQPVVEELKKEFGDRITFVNRYFPLPAHRNSATAALAVEAAAQQGKYEQMYAKMFETQPQWGEKTESQAPLFRTFAEELGLDLTAYDAAVADDKTKERIKKDIADGTALGVKGTPTFFLNGKMLTLETKEQFRQLLADAAK